MRENLNQFLIENKEDLDENTVYHIMQTHGRLKDCMKYAKLKGSYDVVIQCDLNEDNY